MHKIILHLPSTANQFFHPEKSMLLKPMAAVTDCETVLSVKEMNRSSKPLTF